METSGEAYELFRRGSELLAHHNAHQAVVVLERAAAMEPGKASICEALARAYYEARRTLDAEAAFTATIELDPTNDYAHFGLALCLAKHGELRLAAGHLRMALAMRPGAVEYERALSDVVRAGG